MKRNGFTLVEVMVVVAIIGILGAIALPSYSDHVRRGQIQDGTSTLSDARAKMEQFFQDNRTYVGGPCPGATKYFTYACTTAGAALYTVTASGFGSLAGFNYTINQDATQSSSTSWGNCATGWVLKKGDTC